MTVWWLHKSVGARADNGNDHVEMTEMKHVFMIFQSFEEKKMLLNFMSFYFSEWSFKKLSEHDGVVKS